MACHYPKPAYLSRDGKVTFTRREKALGSTAFIHIPCGMCNGCKADHAREWSIRCYHESQLHDQSCFVTLTYRDEMLPPHGSLDKTDLQGFWKRFRQQTGAEIRYFACGEYGEKKGRPHYHAVIFGWMPETRNILRRSKKGNPQYIDPTLSACWHYGEATWTDFKPECARYVAHYTADKLKSYAEMDIDPETGLAPYEKLDESTGEIWKLQPEFQSQSLRPAIGLKWLEKNFREIFPADSVVMDGKEYPVPRFYFKWLQENHPDLHEKVKKARKVHSLSQPYETTMRQYLRTEAREARLKRFKRPTHEKENI